MTLRPPADTHHERKGKADEAIDRTVIYSDRVVEARQGRRRLWPLFQTDPPNGISIGRNQFGIATLFTVANSVNFTNIGVEIDLEANGNLNYFIFNSTTGALLFQTGSKAFVDDGMNFKQASTPSPSP
ncbi:MAG: hypothetical protein U0797_28855 [Gemmataceae bacterium]